MVHAFFSSHKRLLLPGPVVLIMNLAGFRQTMKLDIKSSFPLKDYNKYKRNGFHKGSEAQII